MQFDGGLCEYVVPHLVKITSSLNAVSELLRSDLRSEGTAAYPSYSDRILIEAGKGPTKVFIFEHEAINTGLTMLHFTTTWGELITLRKNKKQAGFLQIAFCF